MDILLKLIGVLICGASIIIAFEIPGTNKDYQTYGIVGCFLLFVCGCTIASINLKNITTESISFGICFILITITLAIVSLLYWNKRKHL